MKYFLHDTNAFQDEKIAELFMAHGYEGLGLFYSILEKLAYQEKPVKTAVLKKQLSVGKKLEKCWLFLEQIELISSNNGETFNNNLLKFSEKYQVSKEKNRKRVAEWRENQAVANPVTHYEHVRNAPKVKEREVKESKENTSLRSEDAATAAAPPEKKIEAAESQPDSPDASASHTRGAADVPTRKKTKRPRPEPGPATVTAYRLPDWATDEFTQRLEEWLVRRQSRGDCRPLQADSIQARIDELAEYDEAFCLNLFRQAKQNPHWQGLTFDNTPHKFTQHIQALQSHAARSSTPLPGAKPTEHAAFGARALSAQLRAIREQRDAQVGSVVHLGPATGPHPGQGAPLAPGVRTPQG